MRGLFVAVHESAGGTNSPGRALRRSGRSWEFNCRGVEVLGTGKDDPLQTSDVQCNRMIGCKIIPMPAD